MIAGTYRIIYSMNRAVIFDLDGVIADTQKCHAQVESELLERFHVSLTPDRITQTYAGVSGEEMFADIFKQQGRSGVDIPVLLSEKWERMEKVTRGRIQAMPYALELITYLKEKGFKLAVASGSPKTFIALVLEALGITDKFDATVSAQEVQQGKPAADIFLLAAKRLGTTPQNTIVIEDGRSGMIGAQRAHMKCIGLVTDKQRDFPATLLISALNQLRVEDIQTL